MVVNETANVNENGCDFVSRNENGIESTGTLTSPTVETNGVPVTPRTAGAVLVGGVALYLLLVSARVTVQRLVNVAQFYGASEAVIGLTVVAVGTSLPEIAAHVTASVGILAGGLDYEVASATALGGSIGSSVTQQTLLVGAFLLGAGQVTVSRTFVRSSYVPMVLSTALTLAADGTVSRVDGLLLFGSFLVYVYYTVDRRERVVLPEEMEIENVEPRTDAAVAVGGMAVVLASAYVALSVVLVESLRLGGSLVGIATLGVGPAERDSESPTGLAD